MKVMTALSHTGPGSAPSPQALPRRTRPSRKAGEHHAVPGFQKYFARDRGALFFL